MPYQANAFAPQAGAQVHSGTLNIDSSAVHFTSSALAGSLPLRNLRVRRGGHNNEQLFFEHPEFPGWSIYSSDPALLTDPILSQIPDFKSVSRAIGRSRKKIPLPIVLLLAFLTLLFALFLLLWSQKDRLVDAIAKQIPVTWEISLGEKVLAQVQSQGPLLTNSPWEGKLSAVTDRLVKAIQDTEYPFEFHIMQNTNVNAFALPGGNVVVLTGLLEQVRSGEELAGVLAHELAHVTRRHSLRNLIKSAGLIVMIQALFGDMSGLAGVAVEGSRYLMQQKFSRDFEREADETGWAYLIKARIDPRGMIQFFGTLKKLAAGSSAAMEGSLSILSTHPASQERIDNLQRKWDGLPDKENFIALEHWRQ